MSIKELIYWLIEGKDKRWAIELHFNVIVIIPRVASSLNLFFYFCSKEHISAWFVYRNSLQNDIA